MLCIQFTHIDQNHSNSVISTLDNGGPHNSYSISVIIINYVQIELINQLRRIILESEFSNILVIPLSFHDRASMKAYRQQMKLLKRYIDLVYLREALDIYSYSDDDILINGLSLLVENSELENAEHDNYCKLIKILKHNRIKFSFNAEYIRKYSDILSTTPAKNILRHTKYYKGNSAQQNWADVVKRIIQMQNLLKYIDANTEYDLSSYNYTSASVMEIGPGAGYFYLNAYMRGAKRFHIYDKNLAFITLAEALVNAKAYSLDITSQEFLEHLESIGEIDIFFAKGVCNIYHYNHLDAYYKFVNTISRRINDFGIWIPYNIDRENRWGRSLVNEYKQTFNEAGWKPIYIKPDLKELVGVNYLNDVETDLWVKFAN